MLARLTALILTLCIGLPMCWCCVTAPQPKQEEVASCCSKKHHSSSEHSQEPACPCARHEDSRDVATTFVKAPAPALKLLANPVWVTFSLADLAPPALAFHAPRHDHGPPLCAVPLYTRHCALLI